jgi:hypothetical protein
MFDRYEIELDSKGKGACVKKGRLWNGSELSVDGRC